MFQQIRRDTHIITDHANHYQGLADEFRRHTTVKHELKEYVRGGLVQLKSMRDALAHGIWIKHPFTKLPVLQYTKGKWSIAEMPNTKHVVKPQGVPITIEKLREFVRSFDGATHTLSNLESVIAAQLSTSPQD